MSFKRVNKHVIFYPLVISLILCACSESRDGAGLNMKLDSVAKGVAFTDSVVYNDGGPPFSDTCNCDWKEFGSYKISNTNYNIYLCGKGFNPAYYSCSWIWGETVYNTFPDDTNVLVMKIHLLDLDSFTLPDNGTEFGHDSLKNYVMATFIRNRSTGTEETIYDPYSTGKYTGWSN